MHQAELQRMIDKLESYDPGQDSGAEYKLTSWFSVRWGWISPNPDQSLPVNFGVDVDAVDGDASSVQTVSDIPEASDLVDNVAAVFQDAGFTTQFENAERFRETDTGEVVFSGNANPADKKTIRDPSK